MPVTTKIDRSSPTCPEAHVRWALELMDLDVFASEEDRESGLTGQAETTAPATPSRLSGDGSAGGSSGTVWNLPPQAHTAARPATGTRPA